VSSMRELLDWGCLHNFKVSFFLWTKLPPHLDHLAPFAMYAWPANKTEVTLLPWSRYDECIWANAAEGGRIPGVGVK
jgi:hypothetical protein